ncbi:bifunctional terpene synthase/polyprenyl synthetase family protein [Aspergillus ibericus CBS 121593]|uniref:Terpenoid synthase n=1 Tax=Aspergillus ibericus CBS 121593 TaxID=1448316 RepID=A0A395GHD7_9EURO|nr:terpenoid synthase [Aspergillus ibericus CBS 121593]RAK94795.1 terpenoid synthase [Aspergillus ibericus CBS 121593]
MPDEPQIWQHSRLVDKAEVEKSGCFTTLPVRISLYDDVADSTAKHGNRVWHWFIGDGVDTATSETSSPVGNLCSFLFPECAPGRVEAMAHINELLLIQKDILNDGGDCKDKDAAVANQKSPRASEATKIVQRLSIYFLRAAQIDHSAGTDILEMYKRSWRQDAESEDLSNVDSFSSLFMMRRAKAGFNLYYFLLAFSQEFKLSALDWATMNDLLYLFEMAMLHISDLYGWQREKQSGNDWATNFIPFYMRMEKMTEDQAMDKMRETIINYEKRFIASREQLYTRGLLPFHLRRWAEVCGAAIAGYHYWCANCPRLNQRDEQGDVSDKQSAVVETPPSTDAEPAVQGETVLPYLPAKPYPDTEVPNSPKPSRHGNLLDDSALLGPVNYIQSLSSKKTLTKLMEAFNVWLRIPDEQLSLLSQVVEDLHNASLILDDIQDESELRRGHAATHLIYGAPQSINSATYMITRVSRLLQTENNALIPIYLEELEKLFIGQSWDLHWKFHKRCPSEEAYFEMVDKKTGALFLMLLRLMQVSSPVSTSFDITHFCRLMGRWYQVRDDYMNLQSTDYSNLKGFCEDLDEGKFSYPVIRACNTSSSAQDIILGAFQAQQGSSDKLARATKLQILRLIDSTGALDHTWKLVRDLHREIGAEIGVLEGKLGGNPMLRGMMKALGKVPAPDVL